MSADQPGSLPSYGQYDPHGYGNRPAAPPKPPMPDTVKYVFYLLLAGAAVQAIGIIVSLTQTDTIRKAMREQQAKQNTNLSPSAIDAITNVVIGAIVVVGLVYVGLWVWMAFKNRAGRQWARIMGTVFFGIQALFTVIGLVSFAAGVNSNAYSAGTTAASLVVSGVLLAIGLIAVLLLWNSRSSAYFAPPPFVGYGPPPAPYGSPYGQPPGFAGMPPQAPGTPGLPPQPPGTPGLPPQPPGHGQPPAPGQGPGDFSPPA